MITTTQSLTAMAEFLLVFDLDGTLVDSVPDLTKRLTKCCASAAIAPLSRAEVKRDGRRRHADAGRARASPRAAAERRPKRQPRCPRFLEIYEANAATLTRPYPGVPETLAALRRRGYRTAVCTNKPQHATIAVLQGLGLAALFDGIAGGDRFAVRKPDPGHLLGLIAELGGRARARPR